MKTILKKARNGCPTATKKVVEALRPRLASMAAYYSRRTGENAEDLLQEAWIGLLEALPQLDLSIGTPEQYLIQRARWRLLDQIKRSRVRRCTPLEDSVLEDVTASQVDFAADKALVNEFTGQLKTVQRMVLCYLLDGMTWREAGDLLGCSSANIAYHVKQIQKKYDQWTSGDACRRSMAKTSNRPAARV